MGGETLSGNTPTAIFARPLGFASDAPLPWLCNPQAKRGHHEKGHMLKHATIMISVFGHFWHVFPLQKPYQPKVYLSWL